MYARNIVLNSLITFGFALEGFLSGTGQIDGAPVGVAVTFDIELPSSPSLPMFNSSSSTASVFTTASVSTLLDTSSTDSCVQALTTSTPSTSNDLSGTGLYHTGTGHWLTGTGSTGYVPYPTGIGWNASNTRSLSKPYTPSIALRSSSVFIVPTSAIQAPALSVGSDFEPHILWLVASASVIIVVI